MRDGLNVAGPSRKIILNEVDANQADACRGLFISSDQGARIPMRMRSEDGTNQRRGRAHRWDDHTRPSATRVWPPVQPSKRMGGGGALRHVCWPLSCQLSREWLIENGEGFPYSSSTVNLQRPFSEPSLKLVQQPASRSSKGTIPHVSSVDHKRAGRAGRIAFDR